MKYSCSLVPNKQKNMKNTTETQPKQKNKKKKRDENPKETFFGPPAEPTPF